MISVLASAVFPTKTTSQTVAAILTLGAIIAIPQANGTTILSDSSLNWNVVPGNYDFVGDQQTGQRAGDIVGNPDNPGFFTAFIEGDNPNLAFRVRLDAPGGNTNNPQFDRFLWVGIDANLNGALDVFLGVNRQGSNNLLQIYAPGTGLNISPSTTTIANTPYFSTSINSGNYNYRRVDRTFDGGTTNDLGLNVDDYYVSFATPISQISNFLATRNIEFDENSAIRYVVATSTQSNSLNQDLGGIEGGINSSSTWEDLGGFSPLSTASGGVIPETNTAAILAASLLVLCIQRKKRV